MLLTHTYLLLYILMLMFILIPILTLTLTVDKLRRAPYSYIPGKMTLTRYRNV